MAKITRKHQKIFAGDVSPTNVVATFGSLKASSPAYSSDPDTIQSLAAWGSGWAEAVINNYAPAIQDLNAVFNVITRQLAYIFQNGVPYWSATPAYYIGSIVSDDENTLYMSVSDTNTNVALTDNTKWLNFHSRKVTTVTSLDYTVLNADWYLRVTVQATAGNHHVNLQTPSATLVGRQVIVKYLNNTFLSQLGVSVTGGSTIDGAAAIWLNEYGVCRVVCNGTNWETF
jgi:hypothetical protein